MSLILLNEESHIRLKMVDFSKQTDHIPAYVYRLGIDHGEVILIKDRKLFDVPKTIHGQHYEYKKAILNDYEENPGSTGVILLGLKGSGKTMLAEDLANSFLGKGWPVIMIDSAIPGQFIRLVLEMIGPCMLMFDEFGTTYDEEERNKLLSFFSDTSLKKVLMVVTANSEDQLNPYMLNRPQRFRYCIRYNGLTKQVLTDLMDIHTVNRNLRRYLHYYALRYSISYDMALLIIKMAAQCRTVDELNALLEIRNVPEALWPVFRIIGVSFENAPFTGELVLTTVDHTLELELFHHETDQLLESASFEFETGKKILYAGEDETMEQWRCIVNDRLQIKLNYCMSEYVPSKKSMRVVIENGKAMANSSWGTKPTEKGNKWDDDRPTNVASKIMAQLSDVSKLNETDSNYPIANYLSMFTGVNDRSK